MNRINQKLLEDKNCFPFISQHGSFLKLNDTVSIIQELEKTVVWI